MAFDQELEVCRSAAHRAGEIALRYREKGISYIVGGKEGIDLADDVDASNNIAVGLKLKSVEQRAGDPLWLRYEVARS